MMERKHGHVVAVSSMCGQMGATNLAPYCASKYAVRGFMESLAVEQYDLRPDLVDKVYFTTIYPYMVNTGLVKSHSVRFNSLMPILNPAQVGAEIVSAMRRNETEVSIPSWLFHFNRFMRCGGYWSGVYAFPRILEICVHCAEIRHHCPRK